MPYDRVNAFGVQRGQVSPAEIFQQQQAEAVRRAHMAALMGSGAPGSRSTGGFSTGGEVDIGAGPQAQKPSEMIGHGGLPYADIARFDREKNAQMDLLKQRGTNDVNTETVRQAPQMSFADLKNRVYDDAAPTREQELIALKAKTGADAAINQRVQGAAGRLNQPAAIPANIMSEDDLALPDTSERDQMRQLSNILALQSGRPQQNFAVEDAQMDLLGIQTRNAKRVEEDREAQRKADEAKSRGDYNAANAGLSEAGLPAQRLSPQDSELLFQTDPELKNLQSRLEGIAGQNTGFYPAMLGMSDWGPWASPNLKNYRSGVDMQVKGEMDKIVALAQSKGADPRAALAYYNALIQNNMGKNYLPGQSR